MLYKNVSYKQKEKGQLMSSDYRWHKAVALMLTLAVVAGTGAGFVTPPGSSYKFFKEVQAKSELSCGPDEWNPSQEVCYIVADSLRAAVDELSDLSEYTEPEQTSIVGAKVGENIKVNGSVPMLWVSATTVADYFRALVEAEGVSEISSVSGSQKNIAGKWNLYFADSSYSDSAVTVKGSYSDVNGTSGDVDTSAEAIANFKSLLQSALDNTEGLQTVEWSYITCNGGEEVLDSGTLTRGGSSDEGGDSGEEDTEYYDKAVAATDWSDALEKYATLSEDAKTHTLVTIDTDTDADGYLVQMAGSDASGAFMKSSVDEYVGKPVLLPRTNDLGAIMEMIDDVSDKSFLVFLGYVGDEYLADAGHGLITPAYASTINGNYIIEVENGVLSSIGIPDWGTVSSDTRTLISDILAAHDALGMWIRYIDSSVQDDDFYTINVRSAGNASTLKSVVTGMLEWTDRPDVIYMLEGNDFYYAIEDGSLTGIEVDFGSCADVRDNLAGFGGSYDIYQGETEYEVKDGVFTGTCPAEHHDEHPAGTNDPGDRHASGDNVPNEAKPQGCSASVPVGTPDVFQIDRQGSKATIYFTPVRDYTDRYHVVFGNQEGDERYSGIAMQVSGEQNNGVLAIDVDNLDPTAQYSFKVAPVNDCAVGSWSNWLTAKGVNKYSQAKVKTYRYQ